MSQPQSIEAARVRIQRLVEEIAALSKGELRTEEYYQQFLQRAVAACDGHGGAVWIVGQRTSDGKNEFQLAAAVELESSLFQTDETQRGIILRALTEVVQTKQPLVLSADAAASTAEPGSLQAQLKEMSQPASAPTSVNRTPYPFIHVPLFLKEQVLGVLQIWLQPYVTRENYAEFATFLTQLASHVEQYFQTRRLGNLVVENQRLQHLLKFNGDLTGSLEPLEVARLAANYGRDLLGSERCTVLQLESGLWTTLAISGQETVEKKSAMVKAMTAFVDAHLPLDPQPLNVEGAAPQLLPWTLALSKKELLAPRAENEVIVAEATDIRALALRPNDAVDLAFFEVSHATSILVSQILDADKKVIGAFFVESTVEGFFDAPAGAKDAPPSHRLTEWLATTTGRALRTAVDYRELPFLFATRRLRDMKRNLTGNERGRHRFRLLVILVLFFGTLLFPWMEEVESDCTLVPQKRVKVVPEVPGRVEKVFVREGTLVKQGAPIAQLDIRAQETELKATREDKLRYDAETRRLRGNNDEAGAQIAATQVRVAEEKEKKLLRDIEAATITSPINGVVLTRDIENLVGVYLQPGNDFAVVASNDHWDVQVHINEKTIGKVEKLLGTQQAASDGVDILFILYTHNTHELSGKFKTRNQLSQVAVPHEREHALRENAFILTLPDIQAPEDVRQAFRPELTGRASIALGRKPLILLWSKNLWHWFQLKWVW